MNPKDSSEASGDSPEWSVTAVDESEHAPRFAYSVGFGQLFDHPEVIVFGLEHQLAHSILSLIAADLAGGGSYAAPGKYDGVLESAQVAIRPVDETQHEIYLGYGMERFRQAGRAGELKAVQLFWPDRQGLFPYEGGCDASVSHLQPSLQLPVTPTERAELLGDIDE